MIERPALHAGTVARVKRIRRRAEELDVLALRRARTARRAGRRCRSCARRARTRLRTTGRGARRHGTWWRERQLRHGSHTRRVERRVPPKFGQAIPSDRMHELCGGDQRATRALGGGNGLRELVHGNLDADRRLRGRVAQDPRAGRARHPPAAGAPRVPGGAGLRAWSAALPAHRTSGGSEGSLAGTPAISVATLPPRSKWMGSMSSPAFARAVLPTMRAPCAKFFASVQGMGSREARCRRAARGRTARPGCR